MGSMPGKKRVPAKKNGGGGRAQAGRPGARPAPSRPAPRTTPSGRPLVPPNKVAVTTAPMLARISALPKALLPVTIGVLVIVGLAVGGVGGLVCLLGVAAILGWLLAVFWPVTPGPGRVLRLLAIVALVAVGIAQAL
jgi:hypothetical protein